MVKKKLEIAWFLVFCVGVSIMAFFIFQPFFNILILAAVLAMLFRPFYKKMVSYYRGGPNFFALVMVMIALVFLIIPVLFLGLQILGQIQNLFALTQSGQTQELLTMQQSVESVVRHLFPNFTLDIPYYVSLVRTFALDNLGVLLSQTAYILFQTFFLLFTFFFFLRDGEKISASLISVSPFAKKQTEEILTSLRNAVTSVVRGTLLVGIIRWAIMTIGFSLLGIPDAMLWGTIGGLIGAIPGVGTPFAIIPAVLYLILSGNALLAIGVGILGILTIVFIDNMLSAYFFGGGVKAPAILILFSIMGGIIFFGPLGFIFGPIILSLAVSMVEMYKILILKAK